MTGRLPRLAAGMATLTMLLGALRTATAYDASDVATVAASCLPTACWDSWEAYGAEVSLPCSVASGHLPMGVIPLALPMVYEGNYDLCQTFRTAHFCRITSTSIVLLPVLSKKLKLAGALPLGTFSLDQCISQACDPVALKDGFSQQILRAIDRLLAALRVSEQERIAIDKEVNTLLHSVAVSCTDQDEAAAPPMDAAGILTVVIFLAFLAAVVLCTALRTYARGSYAPRVGVIVDFFALNHNGPRLVATTPGDFAVLNGIRFWSMAWVILGHTLLLYAYPGRNPNAVADVLESFPFVFIRGAEYAVDTFFFMSGFLATWGVLTRFATERISLKTYGTLVLGRYLRLTPIYALVVLAFWKVIPHLGSGPYWSAVPAASQACEGNFLYNMLYVNNIFPLGGAGALVSCAGWSWYLANDFQFFLLVPLLVQLFKFGHFRLAPGPKAVLFKYGPCAFLVFFQIIITYILVISNHEPGTFKTQGNVYVKPYCRVSPYAIGAALAFLHYERSESAKRDAPEDCSSWKRWPISASHVSLILSAAIAAMLAVVSVLYNQYACRESEHQCNVYFAQYRYGFFASPNWSAQVAAVYDALGYSLWALPLATFSYVLMCDDRYDIFGLKIVLGHRIWAPLARLTYTAYLVHLVIMITREGLAKYLKAWEGFSVVLEAIGYLVLAYATALVLYLVVEKPIMNMVARLFASMHPKPPSDPALVAEAERRFERQLSSVSDLDSETVHLASPELGGHRDLSAAADNNTATIPLLSATHVDNEASADEIS